MPLLSPLYNYALAHHPVHILQHLMFLVASVLMWWPVLSPMPELPRLSYPGQMLYLFLLSIPMAIVAVYTPPMCTNPVGLGANRVTSPPSGSCRGG